MSALIRNDNSITPPEKNPEKKLPNLTNNKLQNLKAIGVTNLPTPSEDIQFISIIGQIEGHTVSPPQKKATK